MKYLLALMLLTGCAAEVGKDNSKDLANENTALKIQLTKVQIAHDQLAKQAETNAKALEACYSRKSQ